jgi:hypothetical protein
MAMPQSTRCAGSEPDGRTTSHPSRSERDYGATGRDKLHLRDRFEDELGQRPGYPGKSGKTIKKYEAESLSENEQLAAGCRPNPQARCLRYSRGVRAKRWESRSVGLCWALLDPSFKKNNEADEDDFQSIPMVSNHFWGKFMKTALPDFRYAIYDLRTDIAGGGRRLFERSGAGDVPAGHRPALRRKVKLSQTGSNQSCGSRQIEIPFVSGDFRRFPEIFLKT